jgi:hypothetical protein
MVTVSVFRLFLLGIVFAPAGLVVWQYDLLEKLIKTIKMPVIIVTRGILLKLIVPISFIVF